MHSSFFYELRLTTVLLLIRDSYTSWSTKLRNLNVCIIYIVKYVVHVIMYEAKRRYAFRSYLCNYFYYYI